MDDVSIVLPTYNREQSIRQSVESILRQTYCKFELVIVDDCSSDRTLEILKSIVDSRIKIIQHYENKGASGARNTGILHSKNEYIAFHDSDDEWLPTKLEKQMSLFKSLDQSWVGVYSGMAIFEQYNRYEKSSMIRYIPDRKINRIQGDLLEELLLNHNFISTQTLVVRKCIIDFLNGFDEDLDVLEDWDLAIRMSKTGKIAVVDEPLVIQNFSDNSLTWLEENRVVSFEKILFKHYDKFSNNSKLLVKNYNTLSGGFRNQKKYAESIKYSIKLLNVNKINFKAVLNILYNLILMIRRK